MIRQASFYLTLFLLLGGCVPKAPLSLSLPEGLERELRETVEGNGLAFGSLEGLAKVKLTREGKAVSVSQVLFLEKPKSLRAEALSPFGQAMLMLATDGEELTVFVPGERTFYRGDATLENIQRLLRIPLRLEDLVRLILYDIPVVDARSRSLEADPAGGYRMLLQGGGGLRQEILFDPSRRLVSTAYFRGEELALRVGYGRFREGDPAFPLTVKLEMPGQDSSAEVNFTELRTNVAIPATRFRLTPPEGIPAIPFPD